ncbi:MAG: hypothetical protein Kow0062_20640 [Acidobacteriota bacterium]
MTSRRRAAWPLVACALAVLAGCAGRAVGPHGGPTRCVEARYSGRFEDARGAVRFVARVRACGDALLVEARGRVGGPSFVAAVRGGRARLLLARERRVVDGPDRPEFWLRHAGVPLSGRWLLDGARASARTLGAWSVRVGRAARSDEPPLVIDARAPDGRRVRLERRDVGETTRGIAWPEVPDGFAHEVER